MRRILTVALALTLALGLAACGGGGQNDAPPLYAAGDVTKISEAGAFTADLYDLEELDADTAFLLYKLAEHDLTREDLKECAVLRSAGATCEEAAVLSFTDADKAEAAVSALDGYITGQISANRDYRPAEVSKLENAWIDRRGETGLLVVANDLEAAKSAVG